jgi:hypothetical protein
VFPTLCSTTAKCSHSIHLLIISWYSLVSKVTGMGRKIEVWF